MCTLDAGDTTGVCTLGAGDSSGVCTLGAGDSSGVCTLGAGDTTGVCTLGSGDSSGMCKLCAGDTTGDTSVIIFCGQHTTGEYLVWTPVSSLSENVFFFSTLCNVTVPSTRYNSCLIFSQQKNKKAIYLSVVYEMIHQYLCI